MQKILDAKLGLHILEVEITTRCNLNCQHCYNRTGVNIDLPLTQFKRLYNFANQQRIWTFIISGGEAILHPQFSKILKFLNSQPKKVRLILQSNGELITEDVYKDLKIFNWIHLSFDPSTNIRQNSWQNLQLAKNLKKVGINAYLFTTIHNGNRSKLNNIVKTANYHKIPIGFNLCMPAINLDNKLLMNKKNFEAVEKKLFKFSQQNKILRYSSPLSAILDKNKKEKFKNIKGGCTAGIAAAVVAPNGDVYPCPFFRLMAGNINKQSLKNIWLKSNLFEVIRNRDGYDEPCASCDRLAYCGGCRNRSYATSGNLKSSDPMCYKFK